MQINTPARRRRIPTLLKAGLALGVPVLLCCGVMVFVLAMQVFKGNSYIEGVVLDSSTRMPLPGVDVAVRNRGWGFVDGRLVWDKDYVYPAISDQNGRFRIGYDVGGSAHVTATKQGYQPYEQWYESNSNITIELKRINPISRPLPLFTIRIPNATRLFTRAVYLGIPWSRQESRDQLHGAPAPGSSSP